MSGIEAKAAMLIEAAPADAYRAFVDRERICQFWLDASSGDLIEGARVEWAFMVPGARDTIEVRELVRDQRIRFGWSDGQEVEIAFAPHGETATRVAVTVRGIVGDDAVAAAVDASEGVAIVLCDLKVLLETGKSPGLVRAKAALIAACGKGH